MEQFNTTVDLSLERKKESGLQLISHNTQNHQTRDGLTKSQQTQQMAVT